MRIGVIANPWSYRNRRRMAELAAVAERCGDVDLRWFEDMAEIPAIHDDFRGAGVGLLVLAGGDGTVQAALTDLMERRPFAEIPPIALLPSGRTNMSAKDVGQSERWPNAALARLVAASRDGTLCRRLVARRVLRVENVRGRGPQRAMFFGAGAITRAIEMSHDWIHKLKVRGSAPAGIALATLMSRWLLRGADADLGWERIGVAVDGTPVELAPRLILLATTLDRVVMGARPYWNSDGGGIRLTGIDFPPRGLLQTTWAVLYGRGKRPLPKGYWSRGATRIDLDFNGKFTLDGEILSVEPGRTLALTAPESVAFVRG